MSFLNRFKNKNCFHFSDSDLDGVGCTILSLHYLEPVCKNLICFNSGKRDMSEIPQVVFDDEIDIVLFTDLTPTPEIYKKLVAKKKQVVIVDHHLTAREQLKDCNIPKEDYYYTDKSCACKLFYDLLTNEIPRTNRVIDRFVFLTNLYDFWQDKHEDWDEAVKLQLLKKGYINWPRHFDSPDFEKNSDFIYAMLEKFRKSKRFMYNFRESNIIASEKRKEDKNFNTAKKNLRIRTDGQGNKYFYIEAPSGLSLIANRLLKSDNLGVKYAVCISTYKTAVESMHVSLRSTKGFSVKDIAEKWGGGGHNEAAAFSFKSEEDYKNLISGKLHLL